MNDDIFLFCDTNYYSSSMINDSLIIGRKYGDIQIVTPMPSNIKTDNFKKDVKFYPMDDYCFTTTDLNGIRIWDRNKEQCVYSYKKENIGMHCYNKEGVMAAIGKSCVKFYDLRVKYHIAVFNHLLCHTIAWGENSLHSVNDEGFLEYDIRKNNVKFIREVSNILSFITIKSDVFCTKKDGESYKLLKFNDRIIKEYDAVERSCEGNKIVNVGNEYIVANINKNKVKFYEYEDTWSYTFDEIENIQNLWYGEKNSFVIADNKVFCIEGGYYKFKKNRYGKTNSIAK